MGTDMRPATKQPYDPWLRLVVVLLIALAALAAITFILMAAATSHHAASLADVLSIL